MLEGFKNILKIAGGVVMILAAIFGVADFRLPPGWELAVTLIGYLLLALLGGSQAAAGYRALKR